jgi:alpha-L-fucosidase 2
VQVDNPLLNCHVILKKQKNMRNSFLIILAATVFLSCKSKEKTDDILWYDAPAKEWIDALPLGNGRIGVMVFGNVSTEHLQLNDDSLWPNDEGWKEPEGGPEDLRMIRQLLFDGKNTEADKLFVEKFSNKSIIRSHQTLGDLYIDLGHKNITEYRRELNISNATATVSYKSNGDQITEKIFVSHPHQAIVLEISSEAKKGLNGEIRLSRPKDKGHATARTRTDGQKLLIMEGEVTQYGGKFRSEPVPILNGVKFETCLRIRHNGGEIKKGEDYLELKNVKRATLLIVSNSSFYHKNYSQKNKENLAAVENLDLESLHSAHVKDYKNLYDRVEFILADAKMDSLSTDKRLENIKQGATDLGLETLLFQYGRYLLISSSREGTNPSNLQGLWNHHIEAPWNADYHLNINLQMNYWLADVTNLSELNNPLFDYVEKLVENGKRTAKVNFGCAGSFMPHATDFWAPTWLRAPTAYWGCSLGAGGWMMQHYWEHFRYTRDMEFLRDRAYPAIKEVAQFYSDWLIKDPRDGTLISAPSTSPENRFINADDERVATCLGSAMDQQVIAEVFDNYMEACAILMEENELLTKIRSQRDKLRPGFILGSDGRILEWDREYVEMEPGHRHMSHLYAFHPGSAVSKDKTPEIFEAVRKTLDYRLAHGGAGTGWSRAWLINCSARLLDGDMAHEHIQLLFKKSISKNLFDMHPPFQIDGNFGYTAGLAEMLLQSHEDNLVRLMPALPTAWKSGHIYGLKARGGITIDMIWSENNLDKAVIKAKNSVKFDLIYEDTVTPVSLEKGDEYIFAP